MKLPHIEDSMSNPMRKMSEVCIAGVHGTRCSESRRVAAAGHEVLRDSKPEVDGSMYASVLSQKDSRFNSANPSSQSTLSSICSIIWHFNSLTPIVVFMEMSCYTGFPKFLFIL